jgi:hypothetical protein
MVGYFGSSMQEVVGGGYTLVLWLLSEKVIVVTPAQGKCY